MNGPKSVDDTAARPPPGPTLEQCVEQAREKGSVGLPVSQAARIVSEVAVVLDQRHAQGRTQGSVTVSQIVVPAHGPARLSDVGPTEPLPDGGIGEDIASLAVVTYFALCGVPPSYFHTMSSVGDSPPTTTDAPASFPVSPSLHRPELSQGVCDVVLRGLSPRGQGRYATAGEFAAALSREAGPMPLPMGALLNPKRILAAVAALIALGAVVAGVWLGHTRPSQSDPSLAVTLPATATPPASETIPRAAAVPLFSPVSLKPAPSAAATHKIARSSPTAAPAPTQTTAAAIPAFPPVFLPPVRPATEMLPQAVKSNPRQKVSSVKAAVRPKSVLVHTYLRVYARQFISMKDVVGHRLSSVPARRILIDGNPSQALRAGHWAVVTPGKHKLAFYPAVGIPFDPNTKFWVQVSPNRRHAFQIPLPRHPGGIQESHQKKSPPRPV